MRVVVIGGTGHIGSYLVPRLVDAGHDVVSISRGKRGPYRPSPAWARVKEKEIDRPTDGSGGGFGERIASLDPEVVIDLICFTVDQAFDLIEPLRGRVSHLLHCGTIWVHGPSVEVPTTEDAPRRAFGDYASRKAAIETYLLDCARTIALPVTLLHPGHLVGPGWAPINPQGNFNAEVFSALAQGDTVALPNLGMETLHHVHADDVAHAFVQAIAHRQDAIGESFHVVSPAALTLRGFAERIAAHFEQEPRLRFLPWDEWKRRVTERDAQISLDHISRSSNCSIAKARERIGYAPRYSSIEAIKEAVGWLVETGVVQTL